MYTRLMLPAMLGAFLLGTPAFAADITAPAPDWRAMMPDTLPSVTFAPSPAPETHEVLAVLEIAQTPAAYCSVLSGIFDATIASHQTSPLAVQARVLSENGGQLCATGIYREGIAKIEHAISALDAPMNG